MTPRGRESGSARGTRRAAGRSARRAATAVRLTISDSPTIASSVGSPVRIRSRAETSGCIGRQVYIGILPIHPIVCAVRRMKRGIMHRRYRLLCVPRFGLLGLAHNRRALGASGADRNGGSGLIDSPGNTASCRGEPPCSDAPFRCPRSPFAGLIGLSPCRATAQDKTLTVFAAASMKNALDDINAAFTKRPASRWWRAMPRARR